MIGKYLGTCLGTLSMQRRTRFSLDRALDGAKLHVQPASYIVAELTDKVMLYTSSVDTIRAGVHSRY